MVGMIGRADQSEYLTGIATLLWPEPTEARALAEPVQQFVVLPSLANPRLVIPARPHRASAGSIRNFKASATGLDWLTAHALALAASAGVLELVPSKISVTRTTSSIENHLSSLLSTETRVALYIGPQRAVQKPVLQVLDKWGKTIAFAKLGTNELTRALVRHEARSIWELQQAGLDMLALPEVLAFEAWRGNELIVQSAIKPGGSASKLHSLLPAATAELACSRGTQRQSWKDSTYRVRLRARAESVADSPESRVVLETITWLDTKLSGCVLDFGSWHGDWAPWNMTAVDGKIVAWDWEHFEADVPIGFDAVHYDLARILMSGKSLENAFGDLLSPEWNGLMVRAFEVNRPLVTALYVLEIATRYLVDGESSVGGTRLSRLHQWLAPALHACMAAVASYE